MDEPEARARLRVVGMTHAGRSGGRAAPVLAPGTVVAGRYRVERLIGEGASGSVFLAERVERAGPEAEAGARVALKVLHREHLRDPQFGRRFAREARILERLRGPGLVRLLDHFETPDGLPTMALELVQGVSLAELLARGPLPAERATRLAGQVCEALGHAHAAGIVHRDLKPGNVVVERAGESDERARVLDFGMGKLLRGDASVSVNALTEQDMVFGTPEYMAPEQARGDDVDERGDVYAVGVLLYEMLTGDVPFRRPTPIATMTAHLVDPPEPASKRAPGARLPPALDAVVLHALAKRPEDRYPTAAALSSALVRASEAPADTGSVAPPPDLALGDTDLALEAPPAGVASPLAGEPVVPTRPGFGFWIAAAIAVAVGVGVGVAMSLAGGR
ncbi:MAG: serine/threonine protein kinase [Polyangiaceae bacterium]|nr:serine/threonine protein kinase [Polyangiaceae bacterium]